MEPVSDPTPRTLWARAGRYGVAGLGATALYAGVVAALVETVHTAPVAAAAIATILVMLTSYAVNRAWVFDTGRSHVSAFSRFAIASSVSLALNTALMHLAVRGFGWHYWGGLVLATAIVPPTNFTINYLWCFKSTDGRG